MVFINSPGASAVMAHLLEFDSTHGHFDHPIKYGEDWMEVGKGKMTITHERDPSVLPHGATDIDIVLECSVSSTVGKRLLLIYLPEQKRCLSQPLPMLLISLWFMESIMTS